MPAAIIKWDEVGEHFYHTGIDRVALFVADPDGTVASGRLKFKGPTPWNGVTAVNEAPSGAEATKIYADNLNYLTLYSKEEFGLTLEAYQSPEEFDICDGTATLGGSSVLANALKIHGVARKAFCLVYRTLVGNDEEEAGTGKNFIYHVVYNCKASPSARDNATVNDSPEAQTLSWEISTTPITDSDAIGTTLANLGVKEVSHLEIDCRNLSDAALAALEAILLYDDVTHIPSPATIAALTVTP